MTQIELILSNVELLLNFEIILWCLIGVTLGTIAGAIPGLGSINGIAILLPLTFGLEVLSALMLLMSIYLGSMYGGRISSILINVPGESSAVATTFDGYPMTKQGKAGYALILSAIASFVGGFIGLIGLIYLTPFLSNMALMFSPPEYFSLMFFALIITSSMGGNLVKGLISLCLGLLISIVGADIIDGTPRLTFGFNYLWDGIDFIIVAIGVFGLSEMLNRISNQEQTQEEYRKLSLRELIPKISDLIRNTGAVIRGSI